jgi:hypothetical protein
MLKKICCKCKIEKDISEFGKSSKSRDGFHYSCKECSHKRSKKYAKDNHDKVLESQKNGEEKILKKFMIDIKNIDYPIVKK